MDTADIIMAALAVARQANHAINLANSGDAEGAEKALKEARENFDAAMDRWDAAEGPTE